MLDVNCLPLISFESRKRKKNINFQVQGHFAHKCEILRGYLLIIEKKKPYFFDKGGKLTNVMQF